MVGAVSFRLGLGRRRVASSALLAGMAVLGLGQAGQTDCVQLAADRYGLPVSVVHAILKVEGGRVGQAVRNSDGSEDLGPMQINTVWLPRLARYGITRQQLQQDRCINILVGSWILARQLETAKNMKGPVQRRVWWGIGAYHSRTPQHNVSYALKVWRALRVAPPAEGD
jgi:soluble lytic murein transglycosylase-like protein